jgi:cold shock CspA family protein
VDGTVDAFDDARGVGMVRAADGRQFFFHCTTIADGSRTIAPGTLVDFDVVAGQSGRWEASKLRRATS